MNLNNFGLLIVDMQKEYNLEKKIIDSNLDMLEFAKNNNIPSYIFEFRIPWKKNAKKDETINKIQLFTKNFNYEYFVKMQKSCFYDYIYEKNNFENRKNPFLLKDKLKNDLISNLIISGVSKSVCVKSTIEDAVENFNIYTAKNLMDNPSNGNEFYQKNCKKYFETHKELIDYLSK